MNVPDELKKQLDDAVARIVEAAVKGAEELKWANAGRLRPDTRPVEEDDSQEDEAIYRINTDGIVAILIAFFGGVSILALCIGWAVQIANSIP